MPKRSKKKADEYSEEATARPPALTLAHFINTVPGIPKQEAAETNTVECEASAAAESTADKKVENFLVNKTKKGKLPISLEKRAKGKKVTVIGNVSGNAEVLLHELKTRVGAGGVVREDCVELQGDHQRAVEKFLTGHPWVKAFSVGKMMTPMIDWTPK